jgi:hypothetical protein
MGACTGTSAKNTNKSGLNNSNVAGKKSRIHIFI